MFLNTCFRQSGFAIKNVLVVTALDLLHCPQMKAAYTTTADVPSIRIQLSSFPGGSVDLHQDDKSGIATIKLNNPDRKNAMSGQMMVDLADAVTKLEEWEVGKGVIVHGADNQLCSGGDLNTVKHVADETNGARMSLWMQSTLSRLRRLPLISVALIQGSTFGGGAEISVACDFRIMAASAQVAFVQSRMGVITGWGGSSRLVRLIGPCAALQLLSTGQKMTAMEATKIGLVNDIVPDVDSLIATREWLLEHISANSDITRSIKKMVIAASELPLEESLTTERNLFAPIWGSPSNKLRSGKGFKHSSQQ